jgi:signal transduction histidine kinase
VYVITLTLLIFALAIWLVTWHVREEFRDRIIKRDGEILHAVATMLQMEQNEGLPDSAPEDEVSQFNVLLKTSRMKWVIATRLYDPRGNFVASFPVYVTDAPIRGEYLEEVRQFRPVDRFVPAANLNDIFLPNAAPNTRNVTSPLLEVFIPLHKSGQNDLQGVAQFIIDGHPIATEFAALDRDLFWQAVTTFTVGSLLMFSSLNWAFRRLYLARQQLRERSKSLLEANKEIALATKTSAVGAVSTHLLHELKSHLFGLQGFISSPSDAPNSVEAKHRRMAVDTTRRMQSLINQVLDVLRNEQGTTRHYEISLKEVADILGEEVKSLAEKSEVNFSATVLTEGTLSSRVANLVIIILMNLVQNGIQATPRRRTVTLSLGRMGDTIECLVRDEGSGFPAHILAGIFKPGHTTKEGGTGIGLALSKQLASHLGAELELRENTKSGCVFALTVPEKLIAQNTVLVEDQVV